MATLKPPTPKQLALLRTLALRAGQTFARPTSRRDASGEIKRLLAAAPSTGWERRRANQDAVTGPAATARDATRFRTDEVEGYGSSARWAEH